MTTKAMTKTKLPTEVLESIWLSEVRVGISVYTIAERENLSRQRIEHGVTRARLREMAKASRLERIAADESRRRKFGVTSEAATAPRLVPLFPIGPFTPTSTCGHHGPIRAGSIFCCMICHSSGMDDHPALKRDPKTDPTPEPSPPPAATNFVPKPGRRRLKQHQRKQVTVAAI